MQLTLVLVLALSAAPALAQQRPCDPEAPLGPSRDLYCIELVPAPGTAGASGVVELGHLPGPFTVAVAPDGRPRQRLIVSVAGLPSPETLGAYRTYVAWVAPPMLHPVVRLGEVEGKRTVQGTTDLEKFVLLITAEFDARASEPSGRVVLRGQSPSTRLFPPDLLEFSLGRMTEGSGSGDQPHSHDHGSIAADSGPVRWTTVPMPPGLTMLPAEMALRPQVTPFLPSGNAPPARPREVIRPADGDTLRLEAGLVTRTLKGRGYTMYAFNGQYPGPLIEAVRGSEITVVFTNRLS
nr:multicopper oxidase domain-containing protein [Gemmatimonadales bacterium]